MRIISRNTRMKKVYVSSLVSIIYSSEKLYEMSGEQVT